MILMMTIKIVVKMKITSRKLIGKETYQIGGGGRSPISNSSVGLAKKTPKINNATMKNTITNSSVCLPAPALNLAFRLKVLLASAFSFFWGGICGDFTTSFFTGDDAVVPITNTLHCLLFFYSTNTSIFVSYLLLSCFFVCLFSDVFVIV